MEDIIVDCPVCREPTGHALLKATSHSITVQCKQCHDVRTMSPPQMRTVDLKLVISHEGEAWSDRLEAPSDEEIEVGSEFELNGHRLIVTGLEFPAGKADKGVARDIKVLHAKVFDTVPLKLSVNEGDITRSYRLDVDPERPVQIGEVIRADGRLLLVKTLKSDQNRTLHKGGLPARHVVRAFCDPAPLRAREGQVMTTRPRGRARNPGTGSGTRTGPGAPSTGGSNGPRSGARSGGPRTGGSSGGPRAGSSKGGPRAGGPGPRSGSRSPSGPRRR